MKAYPVILYDPRAFIEYSIYIVYYRSAMLNLSIINHFNERSLLSGPARICEICGRTFTTEQEKEEHKKLEHKEHREPSGVG